MQRFQQRGQGDGQLHVMGEPAQVLQRIGHALQKMRLALIKSPETIGSEGLQNAHINVGVIVLHEGFAIDWDVTFQAVEIVVEQLLAQLRRQISLAIVEQRSNVVLQRAFASALVVEKKRLAAAQHHIARLEVAVEKIIGFGGQQKFRQAGEIILQRLLAEGNSGKAQKIILEIVQIPGDGLAVEAIAGIADFVIEVASGLHLKTRQLGHHFAIGFNDRRSDGRAGAIGNKKIKERGVAQVFFDVSALGQIIRINLRDRQPVLAKMAGKLEEGDILLAHGIENTDGGFPSAGKPDDGTPRGAELALKRLNHFGWQSVMLLEKPFQNFHESLSGRWTGCYTTILSPGTSH